MTQVEMLTAYLFIHPMASSLEIIRDLAITNATGRLSDLRAHPPEGYQLLREKRPDGRDGYALVRVELTLGLTA